MFNTKESEMVVMHTKGDGYWSEAAKAVTITDMKLGYISDELDFGELRVYFDTTTWNVNEDGLIYTDSLFYKELQAFIKEQGLVVDLSYSEQGMQGDDYVSLDVGKEFLDSWAKKFGTTVAQMLSDYEAAFSD
jgi:hypothetical protein